MGDGFEIIQPSHAPLLKGVFAQAGKQMWCCFPPFLCAFSLPPNRVVKIGEQNGCVCLIVQRPDGVDMLCPPMPFSTSVLMSLVTKLEDSNAGRKTRILWVDEQDAAHMAGLPFVLQKKDAEYLYNPKLIAESRGKPFRDVRKQVHKFESIAQFRKLTVQDIPACEDLLLYWRKRQGRKHPFLLDWGYTRAALVQFPHWQPPDLYGWCVEHHGQFVAFAMAGEILPDVAQFFIAKTNPDVPGLSFFLRFCVYRELVHYRLINDASDLGLPGLQQFKKKFRPAGQLQVYSAEYCREAW